MFEELIATLSARFVDLPAGQAGAGIQGALEQLGQSLRATAVRLFEAAEDPERFDEVSRWLEEPTPSEAAAPLDLRELPWLAGYLGKLEPVRVDRVSAAAVWPRREYAWWHRRGVLAFLAAPVVSRGNLTGVLVVEVAGPTPEWPDHALTALRVVADLVSGARERQRAEASLAQSREELRRAQRLEAMGRMTGGIAHDFNNYLTAIIGYSELAHGGLDESDPAREELEEIRSAADRASGLVEQILSFSRRRESTPRVVDLNAVVAGVDRILRRVAGEEVRLELDLAPDVPTVWLDPARLDQVLVNLAVNARDAMGSDGGRLTIETRVAGAPGCPLPPTAAAGEFAVLSVRDTGCGMDGETQAQIFEPYFTTKSPGRGTGLGLATVAEIIHEAGGSILVDSAPGAGATFHLFLPARRERATPDDAPERALAGVAGGSETILLAEPEAAVRELQRRVLEGYGYRVIEAQQAEAALRVSGPVHLLIADLAMPRLRGRELAEHFQAVRPGVRVLFTSDYPEAVLRDAGLAAEEGHVIEKPFTPRQLGAAVRRVLDPA
ncbi:MAG: ATP-binding protein [Proteobacteria bacterium]|nr:ATP-binding protein [Pseudomonadota bacterium]